VLVLRSSWVRIRRLVGETMREIGVLVVVFTPLEALFAEGPTRPTTVAFAIFVGVAAIMVGIVMEAGE